MVEAPQGVVKAGHSIHPKVTDRGAVHAQRAGEIGSDRFAALLGYPFGGSSGWVRVRWECGGCPASSHAMIGVMFSVYLAVDAAGSARFVGHTRDIERRSVEHAERGWNLIELHKVDNLDLALGLEQLTIEAHSKGKRP